MLVRVQLYDIVAVDEPRIAFDQDREQPLVLEAESGAAVGQRIGRHRRRGVERLAHAAADIAIPPPAPLFGSISAIRHSRNSRACVPLRSPRETNSTTPTRISTRTI